MNRTLIGFEAALALGTVAALSGCTPKLLRENVFANTETMVGATITENQKTQLYELRVGYARHELFLVPTSKRISYDANGDELAGTDAAAAEKLDHNDPSLTPDVLADIAVDGKATQGKGATAALRQRLAVGKNAVLAPAATALMSDSAETAKAVSGATPLPPLTATRQALQARLNKLDQDSQGKTLTDPQDPTKQVGPADYREHLAKKLGAVDYTNMFTLGSDDTLKKAADRWDADLAKATASQDPQKVEHAALLTKLDGLQSQSMNKALTDPADPSKALDAKSYPDALAKVEKVADYKTLRAESTPNATLNAAVTQWTTDLNNAPRAAQLLRLDDLESKTAAKTTMPDPEAPSDTTKSVPKDQYAAKLATKVLKFTDYKDMRAKGTEDQLKQAVQQWTTDLSHAQ